MFPAILICALMVKYAAAKDVTVSLGTPKPCFFIGDNVKLLCAVSSTYNCCGSSRIWQDNSGTNILTDGVPSNASKYEEDYDNGTTGYNLIIKNVQKSDLGLNYKCFYRIKEDVLFLSMNYICTPSEVDESGDCWKCAGQDFGWAFIGTVIGTVIILIIAKVKIDKTKTVLKVGGLAFIISTVVNILVALPIGYLVCHCVDWLLILLGLVTSGFTGGITLMYMLKPGCCKVLIALCAVGSCICCICYTFTGSSQGSNGSSCWPSCKVEQEPKNPKKPSSNEQPLKENKKKKPAAEKSSNEPPLEKKKKKKSAAETGSRSPTAAAKHIKTANNETEMIPTEKGFSGDLEKKRPLPPLTTQLSPTNRPLPLPSSTKPLPSSTRPLPQITTKKGDN